MHSALRMNYIEVSRSALMFSLKLERIAEGSGTEADKGAVKAAAEDITAFLARPGEVKPTAPLFATPHGIRAAIAVSKAQTHLGAQGEPPTDPLSPLAHALEQLLNGLDEPLSDETRGLAMTLSAFFKGIHDYAQGLVARMPRRASESAPKAAVALLR